jgi:phosphohistidine phosphatase SixA
MIRVVFVRHGRKVPIEGRPDHDAPLAPGEADRLAHIADRLDAESARPEVWWASHFDHCWQTASCLNRSVHPVYRLCGLTPYSADDGFRTDRLLQEANNLGAPMNSVTQLGIVGHESRLSQLATAMIAHEGGTVQILDRTDVVAIEGESWWTLFDGCGKQVWRWKISTPGAGS